MAYADEFGTALIEGDAADAEAAVKGAIDAGIDEHLIRSAVIAPAFDRVWLMWSAREISASSLQLAGAIARRALVLVREAFRVVEERRRHCIVLAAVHGEREAEPLQLAGTLLEDAGYNVTLVGAEVPSSKLGKIVREQAPSVVAFTATTRPALDNLPAAVRQIGRTQAFPGVIVWGRGVRRDLLHGCSTLFTTSVSGLLAKADIVVQRPTLN
jgi:methanogenic corrinoid protein MtbC1